VIQSHRGKYLSAHPEEARGTPVEKHWSSLMTDVKCWDGSNDIYKILQQRDNE